MDVDVEQKVLEGIGIDDNIAIGKAVIFSTDSLEPVTPQKIAKNQVEKHKKRYKTAQQLLLEDLETLSNQVSDTSTRDIIETQKQIASDPEIERNVYSIIDGKLLTVDFAVYQTYDLFIERLKESGSALFRQRIVDLEDLRDRFVSIIKNKPKNNAVTKKSIIVTKDISPTELVSYYEDGIQGLIMEKGGITSHAAIIAKSLGIPCMVSVKSATDSIPNQKEIILDGTVEKVYVDPSKKLVKKYRDKIAKIRAGEAKVENLVSETKDGKSFHLMANIEFEAELPEVKNNGAAGIGLLRTESLLFGHRIRKSSEEQEVFYGHILEDSSGEVIIRLFDIGGDKNNSFSNKEANPFLGWRGIRLLLDEDKLLRNQLTAILKTAGKYPGRVKILVPMVSVMEEVQEIKAIIGGIQQQLEEEGEKVDKDIPIGVMVEVPSVAVSAFKFAQEVDFFSIGTNDLTQYTMAVDRGNERIYNLFQHYHPSVLQLIKTTIEGAKKAGITVSVCGELAADKIGAACVLGMGITDLSMVPRAIPKVKSLLSSRSMDDFAELAKAALDQCSARGVKEVFDEWHVPAID
ncbi:phosphoenolpyruvate--protein phosphotransferase [Gracilimonas mengyeensis]|uniref:Phosphoenolpyruvate-protein phosphotransferase n=1 Tax=Gracilimonas mengyeensis TaxID=1302730 RepID=A0A521DL00_9BACT|nr:phosphoenolpyruvate--protein phosphotransferase [Gracilimonas mengyeensis]SMO72404.1 phosphoenolpyruvate--protein phosphotransferase [Gracilimonas mengyeensis]